MISFRHNPNILIVTLGIVMAASLSVIFIVQLPMLHRSREKIDQARTQIQALEYQQANLEIVTKQLADAQTYQTALDASIWKFESEESFYQQWELLGAQLPATLSDITLADAVPTGALLTRSGSVTISGSPNEVLDALVRIQEITPVIGLSNLTLSSSKTRTADVQVEFSTLWQ